VQFLTVPEEESQRLTTRDVSLSWNRVTLKKIKLIKGIASQRKRIRILLMADIPDAEKIQCIGVLYSKIFAVKSHQNQLGDLIKKQRKLLLVNKRKKKRDGKVSSTNAPRIPSLSGGMKENSKLFISNVAAEQVQDRNVMGENPEEGRYPVVNCDSDYFTKAMSAFPNAKVWMDINLVSPREGQQSLVLHA